MIEINIMKNLNSISYKYHSNQYMYYYYIKYRVNITHTNIIYINKLHDNDILLLIILV